MDKRKCIVLLHDPFEPLSNYRQLKANACALAKFLNFGVQIVKTKDLPEINKGILAMNLSKSEKTTAALEKRKGWLLEQSKIPVFFFPQNYLPPEGEFDSFFVPISGDQEGNSALEWAIRHGNALHTPVDVLHMTQFQHEKCHNPTTVSHVGDEFHHEYPKLVEDLISSSSPYTSCREKQIIRKFTHLHGITFATILSEMKRHRHGIGIMEWKGHFECGRARLLKYLLCLGNLPILLIKHQQQAPIQLKTGFYK